MKAKFNLILVVLFSMALNTRAKDKAAYTFRVKVDGVANSEIYFGYHFADKQYISDSVKTDARGQATITGDKPLEGGIYLVVLPNKKYFELLVSGTEHEFSVETDTVDLVKNMKVKGSKENEWFYQYLNFMTLKQKQMESLNKRYEANKSNPDSASLLRTKIGAFDKDVKAYKINFMKEHPESFLTRVFRTSQDPETPEAPLLPNGRKDSLFAYRYFRQHFFDGVDFSDARMLRTPILHNKYKQFLEKLTYQIPDSVYHSCKIIIEKCKANKEMFKYAVVYTTSTYETSKIMGMDAVFVKLVEDYYNTGQAVWADSATLFKISDRARVLKPLLIGKKAPNLMLYDTQNKLQPLWGVSAKYTVVCFWDPDCSHCKKTVPKLADEYHLKLKYKGAEVYGVCTETEGAKWRKFIEDNKLDWINVADLELHNNFRAEWDISTTPVIYILDENKEIIAKKIGVEQISDFIDNYQKIAVRKKPN